MAAAFSGEPTLTLGPAMVAFDVPGMQVLAAMPPPVSADGSRVLYVRESAAGTHVAMHVVVNWFEGLRRLAAAP